MSQTAFALDRQGNITATAAVTTVVFTAHNRRDMVLDAIRLALAQTVPLHIIVADDASTDGTQDAVAQAFPGVTYIRSDQSLGPCFQRNRGVELAQTEIVFPLDDDSMLIDPTTLEVALGDFDAPDVAIVCMPFNNVLQDSRIHHVARPGFGPETIDFAACGHGIRRSAFLSVGGYDEDMFYTLEECDLALRLLDAGGWRTIFGTSPVIHHMQQVGKASDIQDYTGARNKILFTYRYAPKRHMPLRIAGGMAAALLMAFRRRRPMPVLKGLRDGMVKVLSGKAKRDPVKRANYQAFLDQR